MISLIKLKIAIQKYSICWLGKKKREKINDFFYYKIKH